MKKRMLILTVIGLTILSLLAACGKDNNGKAASSPSAQPSQQEQNDGESAATEAPFTFKDTKGEQTLPHTPAYIATTVTYLTDHMIALGLTPKATVKSQNEDFPLYLQPFLQQVDIIGEQGKVNAEKLLSLAPDLIITDTNSTELYDSYAQIAPTAMLENGYMAPDWQTAFRETASVFGLDDKAEQVIGEHDKHKEEAIGQVHDKVAGKTLMVLRIRNDVRYYGDMDTSGFTTTSALSGRKCTP